MGSAGTVTAVAGAAILVAGASACAAIWGFQDPIEPGDGGPDATSSQNEGPPTQGTGSFTSDGADLFDAWTLDEPAAGDGGTDAPPGDGALAEAGDARAADAGGPEAAPDTGTKPGGSCATACLPVATSWIGPAEVFVGTGPSGPAAPSCAGAFPTVAYDGLGSPDAGPAQCGCTCGAPAGGTCTGGAVSVWSDPACTKPCGSGTGSSSSACTTLSFAGCGTAAYYNGTAPAAAGGACAPAPTKTVPPASWAESVRLCAPSSLQAGQGCDAGTVCAPAPGAAFEAATWCVAHDGVQSCPPGFPAQHVYYASGSDTRDCTACSCASPSGQTCDAVLASFVASSCSAGETVTPLPVGCRAVGSVKTVAIDAGSAHGGSCAPDGGQPTGSFAPATPTTVCCTK